MPPLVLLGIVVVALALTALGSEGLLAIYKSTGLASGGLTPVRGESPAELTARNIRDNDRQRETLARFRPWTIATAVLGVVLIVVGVLVG